MGLQNEQVQTEPKFLHVSFGISRISRGITWILCCQHVFLFHGRMMLDALRPWRPERNTRTGFTLRLVKCWETPARPPRDPVQTTKPNCLTASICTTLRVLRKIGNTQLSNTFQVPKIAERVTLRSPRNIQNPHGSQDFFTYWTHKTKWDFNLRLRGEP